MGIVYLNGEFLPQSEAKISVFDRGFLFGDGVYEVIPVFEGTLFQIDEHLDRLNKSLGAIKIPVTVSHEDWKKIFQNLIHKNNCQSDTFNLYLQVTRGADKTRAQAFPEKINPTIVAFCVPVKVHSREEIAAGYSAITLDDTRRKNCFIKAITLLPSILLYEEARQANAVDGILIRDQEVIEGTMSNVFIVKDNVLMTPAENHKLLSGITRQLILKLAKENNIPCKETTITPAMLETADEIWLTGSSKEICPVIKLNGKPVGKGITGPMWQRMFSLYEASKNKTRKTAPHSAI